MENVHNGFCWPRHIEYTKENIFTCPTFERNAVIEPRHEHKLAIFVLGEVGQFVLALG
jgi:hypothetical protein